MELQLSLEAMADFAALFWESTGGARVFAFHGEMGAGKTTTIAALCRHKGIVEPASSPTFSIINQYTYTESAETKSIYHIDLYRLKDEEEIIQSGVEDCVYSEAICFVEWPEKALQLFDKDAMHVMIRLVDENTRQVQLLSAAAFDELNMREQL